MERLAPNSSKKLSSVKPFVLLRCALERKSLTSFQSCTYACTQITTLTGIYS
mgnify:CR=1 FL=1